ncbi:MAG: Asp-tRNA(Asn)/Glu-tRNA(Gln) amidotransferase subunit GatC [Patescibacteria group bacterium]|jgi:aspartyl-tRNA(Asn)/glutamyl-tRNA(Gln) amidotransferase subunit C
MTEIDFDVSKVAKLALLDLTDDEAAALQRDLPSIVSYVSKLHEVDTSEIDAKAYLTDLSDVFRADVRRHDETDDGRDCVAAFPKQKGNALEVPGIFE